MCGEVEKGLEEVELDREDRVGGSAGKRLWWLLSVVLGIVLGK